MILREAMVEDIETMMAIRLAVQENRLSDPTKVTWQMYQDYLQLKGRGWVCEVNGFMAGFVYVDKTDDSIWALFVLPEYEGIGVGKQLLKLATDWLFARGARQIRLATEPQTRADRFYQSQGWQRGPMLESDEVRYTLHKPGD